MSIGGISNREKASQIFQSLEGKLDTSQNPLSVLKDFLRIMAMEEATKDLAKRIVENYGMYV